MRRFSNTAVDTTISAPGIGSSDTSIAVEDVTGWPVPASGDSALAALGDTHPREIIEYTGVSGSSLTGCTRGVDGTTAAAHSSGAEARHIASGYDFGRTRQWIHTLRSGYWQSSARQGNTTGQTSGYSIATLHAMPLSVAEHRKINGLRMQIGTTGGTNIRLGIYEDNGQHYPGALVYDSGTLTATASAALVHDMTASPVAVPGSRPLCWLAFMIEATTSLFFANVNNPWYLGDVVNGGIFDRHSWGWQKAQTFGAMPNPFPAAATDANTGNIGNPPWMGARGG